jgi:hypothetical protein
LAIDRNMAGASERTATTEARPLAGACQFADCGVGKTCPFAGGCDGCPVAAVCRYKAVIPSSVPGSPITHHIPVENLGQGKQVLEAQRRPGRGQLINVDTGQRYRLEDL